MKNYFYLIGFGLVSLFNVTLVAQEDKPDEKKKARVIRFVPGSPDPLHSPTHNASQARNHSPFSANGSDPAVVNQKTVDAAFAKLVELFRVDFNSANLKVKKEFSKDEQLKMIHNFECQKSFIKELFIFLRERERGRLSQVLKAFENYRDRSDRVTINKYMDRTPIELPVFSNDIVGGLSVNELKAIQLFFNCLKEDLVGISALTSNIMSAYQYNSDLVETFFKGMLSLSCYIERAYKPSCGTPAAFFDTYLPIWEKAFLQILDDAIAVFSAE